MENAWSGVHQRAARANLLPELPILKGLELIRLYSRRV